jgi:hypothetical protein
LGHKEAQKAQMSKVQSSAIRLRFLQARKLKLEL